MINVARGEIYWANLSPVEGSEQGGYRPVLILSNSIINKYSPVIMIAPLTRYDETIKLYPTDILVTTSDIHYQDRAIQRLKKEGHLLNEDSDSKVLSDQARAISKDRLIIKVGKVIRRAALDNVSKALAAAFAIDACDACDTPLEKHHLKCTNPKCKKNHRKKCTTCGQIVSISHKYCFNCGKGV